MPSSRRRRAFVRLSIRTKTLLEICATILALLCMTSPAMAAPVKVSEQEPVSVTKLPDGSYLLDFGHVLFGNLLLDPAPNAKGKITVRFGQALRDGRVDRTPPGSVSYAEVIVTLDSHRQIVAPQANPGHLKPPAVQTPARLGVLLPFRWVEIAGWPGGFTPREVRRRAVFDSTWNDHAASFHASDPMLDRVWALCHDSIKATTFAGIFVDGNRERRPYEADAYQDQLSYYAGDPNAQMERDTFAYLMKYPTWPTEWAPQMVFMAYADWMQTADKAWLAQHYDQLKTKLLLDRVGVDGLVHSSPAQMQHSDIVDWPAGERDGYVFTPVNTVVNAFYLHALEDMRQLALIVGRNDDASVFAQRENIGLAAFQRDLFNAKTGLYRDGIGTDHSSLHANLFPLAFGLVPPDQRVHVAQWLAQRGMRGSVYAAQFLLEGLFENGQAAAALKEMTAAGDRSWRHMVESGATITWEAWDLRYKPNDDWTHAWGAAPANLLPRFVLGVQVSKPGWAEVEIAPHPGDLHFAQGTIPTPRGSLYIRWRRAPNFTLNARLPPGIKARIRLPAAEGSQGVWSDGHPIQAHLQNNAWVLDNDLTGSVSLQVR